MEYLNYISILIPILIALFIYLFARSKKDPGYQKLLLQSFFFGMISILIVLLVQLLASYFDLDNLRNLRRILFYSLVIVAFFSELAKFFFLKIYCYPDKDFRSPLDGIIFAIMIAMGFATLNNILTLVNIPNLSVNYVNAITSGPANIIFGGLMGFFIGLGKTRKMRWIDSMTGLAAAIFFHALYAFTLITKDYKLLIAFFIGSTIILVSLWIASLRMDTDIRMNEQR
jgi:RsiW-degrading membrane proteinase PrsW (M82 family)